MMNNEGIIRRIGVYEVDEEGKKVMDIVMEGKIGDGKKIMWLINEDFKGRKGKCWEKKEINEIEVVIEEKKEGSKIGCVEDEKGIEEIMDSEGFEWGRKEEGGEFGGEILKGEEKNGVNNEEIEIVDKEREEKILIMVKKV